MFIRGLSPLFFFALALLPMLAAWAEAAARRDSAAALEQAIAIEGWAFGAGPNVNHLERLAEADPRQSRTARKRALQANPRRAFSWILSGLDFEQSGDFQAAERALLEAARVDRQLLPAWTLANFYFRRGRGGDFWAWAALAAARTYDDFRPLLRLCEELEPDPARTLDLLESTPSRPIPRLERAYLDFLIGERRLDAAEVVAHRMAARRAPEDQPRLLDMIAREIRAGRGGPALALWNTLFIPLDPQRGPVLTNGDLRQEPTGRAFDWNIPKASGVAATWSPGTLAFDFSGLQPDHIVLLEQTIPVSAGTRYVLSFDFRNPPPNTAPRWEIDETPMDGAYTASQTGLVPLRLVYRRLPGEVPLRGRFSIGNIRLEVSSSFQTHATR